MTLDHMRYTKSEAASILRISKTSLERRIKDGRIRAIKDGSLVFIHRDELDRYLRGASMPRLRKAS